MNKKLDDKPLPEKAFEGDFKNAVILSIVREDDKVAWLLEISAFSNAAKTLGVLLDRLEIPSSNKRMLELREQYRYGNIGDKYRADDIRLAFRETNHFLAQTYFKDKNYSGIDPNAETMKI